jgi:triosephosphate isomerase
MQKMIVAGNWKMNASVASTEVLLESLKLGLQRLPEYVEMVVFPPFPYLSQAQQALLTSGIELGAQNASDQVKGAFTGEVSMAMLAEFGVKYVLVGHSERRVLYGESDVVVAAKFAAAQSAKLVPVLCVGETLEQRKIGDTVAVVTRQVQAVIDVVGVTALMDAVVAYEPIWAIGTGLAALPEQAQQVHSAVRSYVAKQEKTVATGLRIIYGGSINAEMAEKLFMQQDIDGVLVGGASLTAQSFLAISQATRLCAVNIAL